MSISTRIDESWTANGWSGDRYQQRPGQVDRIWILDVDGERLVVDLLSAAGLGRRIAPSSSVSSTRFGSSTE